MRTQCSRVVLLVPYIVLETLDPNGRRGEPTTLGRSAARIRRLPHEASTRLICK